LGSLHLLAELNYVRGVGDNCSRKSNAWWW